jgi:hypothetical protein
MPDPVIEQIADTLVTRLQAITTTGNAYLFTVSSVIRPDRKGTPTATDYLVVVEQTTTERNDDLTRASATGLQIAWDTEFQITCYLRPSDSDTTALDQLGNIALSEMTRAIASTGTWYTFGSKAIDATFTGQENFSDDSGAGVKLMLQVTYRIDESDPRTERP